jgi:hypothetical protein
MADPNPSEAKRRWFEPASAILMALATLSTVWCSYQSSKWNGHSSELATNAQRLEQKAALLHLEDTQVLSIQVKLFMGFIDARVAGNDKLAQYYSDRFPPELRTAFDRWLAQKPLENPKADLHPFVPSLYKPRFADAAQQATEDAARDGAEAKRTANFAAQYLSTTVLLATVLFFAGTSAKFDQRVVRQSSLFFAVAVFLFAVWRMIALPVTGLFS